VRAAGRRDPAARGRAAAARGTTSFVAEALAAARAAGATGLVLLRADAAFYAAEVVAACCRAGAHLSITVRLDPAIRAAIAGIVENACTPIRYPRAVWDDEGRYLSDAEIAEIADTAFTSRRTAEQRTGRLLVRRVRRLNPAAVPQGQGSTGSTSTACRASPRRSAGHARRNGRPSPWPPAVAPGRSGITASAAAGLPSPSRPTTTGPGPDRDWRGSSCWALLSLECGWGRGGCECAAGVGP
jgi:hypothetical protein